MDFSKIELININGYDLEVFYDTDICQFHGEFIGLNSGADCYAANLEDLYMEAEKSLNIYLTVCTENRISAC